MDTAVGVLNLLGALGVFLFGMKVMSKGLQEVAGDKLKGLLAKITGNRFKGVLTGFGITTIIQSSSATTVMVVGFVNAGLLNLIQAIGVIMGANIGTTVTGWLVALLGFKVKITTFALPAIGIGLILTFLKPVKARQWGDTLIGFGLLFVGLGMLKSAVPEVEGGQLTWIQDLAGHGLLSTIAFIGIGTALTVVLQSSSATMALTLTMTAQGLIPYEAAIAMVLGENIGTTATANIAAIGTSVAARRAALAHLVFNLVGVLWAIALMRLVLLPTVDWMVPGDPLATGGGDEMKGILTAHLAAFHTLFNVVNTGLMLGFVRRLARFVTRAIKDRQGPKERVAKHLSFGVVETPELLVEMVSQELDHMTEIVRGIYDDALHIVVNPDESLGTLVRDTRRREELVHALRREISEVLATTARASTSEKTAYTVARLALNAHRVEAIAGECGKLLTAAAANHDDPELNLDEEALGDLARYGELVRSSLDALSMHMRAGNGVDKAKAIEQAIDAEHLRIRRRYIRRIQEGDDEVTPSMLVLDLAGQLERLADHVYDIMVGDGGVGENEREIMAEGESDSLKALG